MDAGRDERGSTPRRPSNARILIWVIVGGIGLYLLISGIVGVIVKGG